MERVYRKEESKERKQMRGKNPMSDDLGRETFHGHRSCPVNS